MVESHRGAGVGDRGRELGDVAHRVVEAELDALRLPDAPRLDRCSRAPPPTLPGSPSARRRSRRRPRSAALSVTLQRNFSQTIRSMSANALTLNPASRHVRSMRWRRSDMPPCISPMRIRRMPWWWTEPGSGIDDPKPSAIPMAMCSSGICRATRSPAPRPFWNAITTSPGRKRGAMSAATDSTSAALVPITHRSLGPASAGARPVCRSVTTYSPLAPETRSPSRAMASMWSSPDVDRPDLVARPMGRPAEQPGVDRPHRSGPDDRDLHRRAS